MRILDKQLPSRAPGGAREGNRLSKIRIEKAHLKLVGKDQLLESGRDGLLTFFVQIPFLRRAPEWDHLRLERLSVQ